MGVFGTSSAEEDKLRSANNVSTGEASTLHRMSESGSSAYLTADEGSSYNEDSNHGNDNRHSNNLEPSSFLSRDDDRSDSDSVTSTIKARKVEQEQAIANSNVPSEQVSEIVSNHEDLHVNKLEPTEEDDAESSVQDFEGDDELPNEDELNRRFTLERISTHRTIEELANEEIRRVTTRASNEAGEEVDEGIPLSQLDWDDVNDKNNPQNWPSWKKWYVTFTVAGICLCVSLGSSLYTSGVFEIEERFGASQELVISGLTFYLLGLAFGPVFAAPLSEAIGRRFIYIISLPISMLFTMGVGLSQNIYSVLILRFFCGLFASPALAVAGGSVSDIWLPEEIGFAMALFCLAPFLGPVLGPVIGNFAAQHKGWRFTMWVSLMFSGAVLIPTVFLPETFKRTILINRAKKRGVKVILPKIDTKALIKICLSKPMEMLFTDSIVFFFSFYIAFVFAVLFGFFEAFPIIFLKVYKMDQGISGLPFIGVGIGLLLGVLFFIALDKFYFFKKNPDGTRGKRDENGNIVWDPPETRLIVGQVGSFFLPIALFWLGWTSRELIHWISPVLAGLFFGIGLILVFFMCILYFSMAFPPINLASALAANNFLRYVLAGAFPLFTVQMYNKLGIDWASSLFGFIALVLIPVPFIFQKYGAKFRNSSKYGYVAFFTELAKAKKEAELAAKAKHNKTESSEKNEGSSSEDTSFRV